MIRGGMRPAHVAGFLPLLTAGVALQVGHVTAAGYELLIGVSMAVVGVLVLNRQFRLERTGERARGTVVGQERESLTGHPGAVSYAPVVRFRTRAGQEIETSTRVGMPAPPRLGRRVRVLYDPEQPTLAEIDTFRERGLTTITPAAFIVVGAALAAAGAASLLGV